MYIYLCIKARKWGHGGGWLYFGPLDEADDSIRLFTDKMLERVKLISFPPPMVTFGTIESVPVGGVSYRPDELDRVINHEPAS